MSRQEVAVPTGQEIVITHVFAAPRELVWRALTDCEHLKHWWGPRDFTVFSCDLDLRPGGRLHYGMQSADGYTMWGAFDFREIVAPELLVFTNTFADEDGNTIRAPFSADWPLEILNTWTLAEHDGQTTLTLRAAPVAATEAEREMFASESASMQQGYGEAFGQLDEYLARM